MVKTVVDTIMKEKFPGIKYGIGIDCLQIVISINKPDKQGEICEAMKSVMPAGVNLIVNCPYVLMPIKIDVPIHSIEVKIKFE